MHAIEDPNTFHLGPFQVDTVELPLYEPNIGFRISTGGITVAYTGDSGPAEQLVALAENADLFLAQAMYATEVPERDRGNMCSAVDAGRFATRAGVDELMLIHLYLMRGVTPEATKAAARTSYRGPITVAHTGLVWSRRIKQTTCAHLCGPAHRGLGRSHGGLTSKIHSDDGWVIASDLTQKSTDAVELSWRGCVGPGRSCAWPAGLS